MPPTAQAVDFHCHAIPPALPALPGATSGWPSIRMRDGEADLFIGSRHFRTLDYRSWDPAARLVEMDADGVELQVLSPIPATLAYGVDPSDAARLCRAQNEWLASVVDARPDAFAALGALPLQDPSQAAAMVPELRRDGLAGVEIGTHVNGTSLGAAGLDPIFEACAALDMVVFVHPVPSSDDCRLARHGRMESLGFLFETAEAATDLVLSGILDRHPSLRVVLAHGGGSLWSVASRLSRCWEMLPSARGDCSAPPFEYLRRFFYDSLVYNVSTLRALASVVGTDRIVVGSDYPFALGERPVAATLRAAGFEEREQEAMLRETALSLLR